MSIYFMLAAVHALIFYGAYRMYKLIKSEDQRYAGTPGMAPKTATVALNKTVRV